MRKVRLLSAVLALLGLADTLTAQTATGQITGTVKDATGAVVPGATVTVISELTGSKREAVTGKDGNYVIPAPARQHIFGDRVAARLPCGQADRHSPVRRSGRARRPGAADGSGDGSGRGAGGRGGPRYRECDRRPGDHREADHRPAAQRAELPVAAVPGGRRGRDRRRAGDDAAGRRERDQPHGCPADLEQLHDRRDGEHRHGPRHPGRDPVRGRHGGVQGADQDLLRGVRLQRQPDQPRQQVRHERDITAPCSTSAGTRRSMPRTSSTRRPRRSPSWTRSSSGGRSAVRSSRTRPSCSSTTRARGSNGGRARSTSCRPRTSWRAGSRPTIIDPLTGQPFPNNTIPASRFSRLAQLTIRNGWYPAPNVSAPQGNFQLVRTLPQTQNQFTVRLDQDLGRFGRAFGRFTKTTYENTSSGTVTPDIGDILFSARHEELAGVPHLAHPEQRRQRAPGRPRGGLGQPGGDRLFPGGHRLPGSDGRLHGTSPTRRGDVPASACRDIRTRAATSTTSRPAINPCGTSATRPPG